MSPGTYTVNSKKNFQFYFFDFTKTFLASLFVVERLHHLHVRSNLLVTDFSATTAALIGHALLARLFTIPWARLAALFLTAT